MNVEDNIQRIQTMLLGYESAIDILVLPENFACMAKYQTQYLEIAEKFGKGVIQSAMSKLAKQHKLWLVAGSIPIKHESIDDKVYTSCLVFNPDGDCVLRYDKIHLFDVVLSLEKNDKEESYQESKIFIHGDVNQQNHFSSPWGDIAVSICYDLRFPEMYRRSPESVLIHCLPAAFTAKTGEAHWQPLLRARAIENQAVFIASSQVGLHKQNNRVTWGHSMIIDAWGEVKALLKNGEGIISVEIDLQILNKFRQKFPCLSHKRTYH